MDSSSVLQFIFLVILIALSAFFSSAETALTTVNRVRVRTLIEEGNKRAVILQKILDNYSKMLSKDSCMGRINTPVLRLRSVQP